jgi:hypothetical protein
MTENTKTGMEKCKGMLEGWRIQEWGEESLGMMSVEMLKVVEKGRQP